MHPRDRLARKLEKSQKLEIVGEKTLHPRDRKKLKEKRIAQGNLAAITANIDFDTSDYIDKPLIFDLKKTSQGKIMARLIKCLPRTNGEFYIERKDGTSSFRIRKDPRQVEKEHLMELILNAGKKIARTNKKV